jgi:hypothetical protein
VFLDYLINLKIIGRSSENTTKAQKLIKEFEEQKYSTRKIHNNDINLFTGQNVCLALNQYSIFILLMIVFRLHYLKMNVVHVMFHVQLISRIIQLN